MEHLPWIVKAALGLVALALVPPLAGDQASPAFTTYGDCPTIGRSSSSPTTSTPLRTKVALVMS